MREISFSLGTNPECGDAAAAAAADDGPDFEVDDENDAGTVADVDDLADGCEDAAADWRAVTPPNTVLGI